MAHANHRPAGVDLTHAGAGTALAILGLSTVIPGLLPAIVLIAAITVVLVVPLLALALCAGRAKDDLDVGELRH